MFGERFPYTNTHELNLDWIIQIMKEAKEKYPAMYDELMRIKLNAPADDVNGTVGDFLVSNGDGSTSWKPFDDTIGAEIVQAVNAWLVAHPEATTTVQDHSLTYEKLVIGTLGFVTPEMFGAAGDGVTNDREAIQAALDAGPVVVFSNQYLISSTSTAESFDYLTVPSDRKLIFTNQSIIKIAGTNHFTSYAILLLDDVQNVTIDGAIIIGDKAEYGYDDSTEWCHGIAMQECNYIRILNSTVVNCRGDGIALQNTLSDNVWIDRCFISDNGRNNISVTSGDHVKITNCRLDNTDSFAPMYGIDIEPNIGVGQNVKNCVIDNCTFSGNTYGAITIAATQEDERIYISNCTCEGAIGIGSRGDGCSVIVSNCTIIPIEKVSASDNPVEWAYNVGVALAVQCGNSKANVLVSDIVIDCRNGISYPVKIIGNNLYNTSLRNIKITNGTFDSYSWHPQEGSISNVDMEFVVDSSAEISGTVVAMAGRHTETDTGLKITVQNTMTVGNTGNACLANEIIIADATNVNIPLSYPYRGFDAYVKTTDASGHNLMGMTFKHAVTGAETSLLGIAQNVWFHLWWDVYAEKMFYYPLNYTA